MTANDNQQRRNSSPMRHPTVMLPIDPSDMRQIEGGRCWDGPLGDRRECPPKPTSGGGMFAIAVVLMI